MPTYKVPRHVSWRGDPIRSTFDVLSDVRKHRHARTYRDHRELAVKLRIRRWLLDQLQWPELHVLDACSGDGLIWSELDKDYTIRRWIRCDLKPRGNLVLKLSAAHALATMDLDDITVVDIDPFGEPWEAYLNFLERFTRPTAVFLTYGAMVYDISNFLRARLHIPLHWNIPQVPAVMEMVAQRMLGETRRYATIQRAATLAMPPGNGHAPVRYYALAISRK
jgi:hypothetical protein